MAVSIIVIVAHLSSLSSRHQLILFLNMILAALALTSFPPGPVQVQRRHYIPTKEFPKTRSLD